MTLDWRSEQHAMAQDKSGAKRKPTKITLKLQENISCGYCGDESFWNWDLATDNTQNTEMREKEEEGKSKQ